MNKPTLAQLVVVVFAVCVACGTSTLAGTIELEWNALNENQVQGYRVFWGTNPGSYDDSIDVGNVTQYTLTGLDDCTTWHVSVKAYDDQGTVSGEFSNEIAGWARPQVTAVSPPSAMQGDQFTLNIDGANFSPDAQVEISTDQGGTAAVLPNVAVLSCDRIQLAASLEPTADGVRAMQTGSYTVTILTTDDVFGERADSFVVLIDPERFDLNRDQASSVDRVDGWDVISLSHRFATQDGEPLYDPRADLDGNGWVDGDDLTQLAINMGRCWNGTSWNIAACNQQP